MISGTDITVHLEKLKETRIFNFFGFLKIRIEFNILRRGFPIILFSEEFLFFNMQKLYLEKVQIFNWKNIDYSSIIFKTNVHKQCLHYCIDLSLKESLYTLRVPIPDITISKEKGQKIIVFHFTNRNVFTILSSGNYSKWICRNMKTFLSVVYQ